MIGSGRSAPRCFISASSRSATSTCSAASSSTIRRSTTARVGDRHRSRDLLPLRAVADADAARLPGSGPDGVRRSGRAGAGAGASAAAGVRAAVRDARPPRAARTRRTCSTRYDELAVLCRAHGSRRSCSGRRRCAAARSSSSATSSAAQDDWPTASRRTRSPVPRCCGPYLLRPVRRRPAARKPARGSAQSPRDGARLGRRDVAARV